MKARLLLTIVVIGALSSVINAIAPGNPQNLSANVTGTTVALSWSAPSVGGAPTGYIVNAALSPGGAVIAALPVSGTSLIVTDVPIGVYYVHVRAVNIDGTSGPSNEIIVSVPSGPSGCTAPPNAPGNLTANVAGNLVTLTWTAPVGGCAPTRYVLQAGSAQGLSDLAILNVGATPALTVAAPVGIYYVRVIAVNAFGGSIPSVEVVVVVGVERERFTITFNGLSGGANGAPVSIYTEAGFTITPTAQSWQAMTTLGNPAPFIQFVRRASQSAQVGELVITRSGDVFDFESMDLYSSITVIPHEVIGLRNGGVAFRFSATVPNTFGQFATVSNPNSRTAIDTLLIRLTNPATACCDNPVGIDNIVLGK